MRQAEDIRVQELKEGNSHLFIALAGESSDQVKPVFTVQFLFDDLLDHIQKLLCDEAFKFAEGLLLKNDSYLFFFGGCALAENQLSNFFKQGRGWVRQVSLQFFLALVLRQVRQLAAREFQEFPHLVVYVGSARCGGQFLPSQQLGNVGLCNFGGGGQTPLLKPQFFQPLFDRSHPHFNYGGRHSGPRTQKQGGSHA